MKKTKSRKQLCSAAIMVFLLVALDQLTKYLAVLKIKMSGKGVFELIPGVFELRYLENHSAAFGVDLLSIIQRIFHFSRSFSLCVIKTFLINFFISLMIHYSYFIT